MIAQSGGGPRVVVPQTRPLVQQAAADYPDLLERYDRLQADDPVVVRALGFDFGLAGLLDRLAVRLDQQELPAGTSPRPKTFRSGARLPRGS